MDNIVGRMGTNLMLSVVDACRGKHRGAHGYKPGVKYRGYMSWTVSWGTWTWRRTTGVVDTCREIHRGYMIGTNRVIVSWMHVVDDIVGDTCRGCLSWIVSC